MPLSTWPEVHFDAFICANISSGFSGSWPGFWWCLANGFAVARRMIMANVSSYGEQIFAHTKCLINAAIAPRITRHQDTRSPGRPNTRPMMWRWKPWPRSHFHSFSAHFARHSRRHLAFSLRPAGLFHWRYFNLFRLMCAHKCINCSMHYPLVEWAERVHQLSARASQFASFVVYCIIIMRLCASINKLNLPNSIYRIYGRPKMGWHKLNA